MKVVCREFDRYGDRPPAHYIVNHNPDDYQIGFLRIRARYNPELHYYVTKLDEEGFSDETIIRALKNKKSRKDCFLKL